jgi:hypothetical protein
MQQWLCESASMLHIRTDTLPVLFVLFPNGLFNDAATIYVNIPLNGKMISDQLMGKGMEGDQCWPVGGDISACGCLERG